MLRICYLATGVFAAPFNNKGCLLWRHSSCLQQICHNIRKPECEFLTICLYDIQKLNPRKTPGQDLITARILEDLPTSALSLLTAIYNAVLRTGHFPSQWKVVVIILIPKAGKPPEMVESYRPISLLPIMSKLLEKLCLKDFSQSSKTDS
jgi:hypothetical protein